MLQTRILDPFKICDETFFVKVVNGTQLSTNFAKRVRHRCLAGAYIHLWP